MKKDQLFRKHPNDELFTKVINCFGLTNLNDSRSFSRNDLKIMKTVDKVNELKLELSECYLPCKARSYLYALNEKNVVTVLRQILKTRNYTIVSREKYMRGEKFIIYSLTNLEAKNYNPIIEDKKYKNKNVKPILITFD